MQTGRRSQKNPTKRERRRSSSSLESIFLHLVLVELREPPRSARRRAELGLSAPTVPPPQPEERGEAG